MVLTSSSFPSPQPESEPSVCGFYAPSGLRPELMPPQLPSSAVIQPTSSCFHTKGPPQMLPQHQPTWPPFLQGLPLSWKVIRQLDWNPGGSVRDLNISWSSLASLGQLAAS